MKPAPNAVSCKVHTSGPGAVRARESISWLLNSEPGEKRWKFPAEVQSGTAACAGLAGQGAPGTVGAVYAKKRYMLMGFSSFSFFSEGKM